MIALTQSRWVLGLTFLALFTAGPAFAQAPPQPIVFTFDENGHGSETLPNGTVFPLHSLSNILDPGVGVIAPLFYPLPFNVRDGFVGLTEPPLLGFLSDVLHFSFDGGGVYFYSDPPVLEPGTSPPDLADPSFAVFVATEHLVSKAVPEVGSEGANGALYVPGTFDPGFAFVTGFSASYNIISDAGPGSTVPEPSSLILRATGVGLAALAGTARRRHRRK